MRLWFNILMCAALGVAMAQARPGLAAVLHPAGKAIAGKPLGALAKPLGRYKREGQAFGHGISRFGQAYGFGAMGYGVPGVYADSTSAAGRYDPSLSLVSPEGYAPPVAYGYERAPQLTCFRPRLIVIGRQALHNAHLPKVVYGGPLPCGFTGT